MPRLIDDAGDLTFFVGVAEDKAILPDVLYQPFLDFGALLGFVQMLIVDVHNNQVSKRQQNNIFIPLISRLKLKLDIG